jgi:hypothetical protein
VGTIKKPKFTVRRRAIIIEKPSGIIAITGSLDVLQRKFFNVMLKSAKEQLNNNSQEVSKNRWFYIKLIELKKYIDVGKEDRNNKYYKEKLKELKKIEVEYNLLNKDKNIKLEGLSSLISDIQFVEDLPTNEVVIRYYLSGIVYDSLQNTIDKNGVYAELDLIIMKGLKSKYSLTLYELCRDYKNVEIPEMTIERFKKMFGLESKKAYNFFPNIRLKVLDPAIKEINDNPDVDFTVEYQLKKSANTYTYIKFLAKPKPKQKELEQKRDNMHLKVLIDAVPEQERSKQLENYLAKCLKDYDARYLLHQIEYVAQQKPKSFFAYLKKAIEEDYAKAELVEEQEKAEQERIERLVQQELKKLEAEKLSLIDMAVDREKDRIYEEYVSLLENNEKQELFNEYRAKTKELYQDVKEGSFLFEETMKSLITEYIISKNEIYQKRLEKIRKDAEEKAERAYQREKETLREKIENGYSRLPLTLY